MLYTEKEKNEIERVRKVFADTIQQSTAYEWFGLTRWAMCWLAISAQTRFILNRQTG